MIKALIDTNVILDIALKRELFFKDASNLFAKIDNQIFEGYISASSITDIYYIVSKQLNKKIAHEFLLNLIQVLELAGVDREIVEQALASQLSDFEDAIQVFSAKSNGIDFIVTRNIGDFSDSEIPVKTPAEFINMLEKPLTEEDLK